ncbi:TIGR02281 family clan AA aspartic protease [Kineobactrum sediminis]|uniref:TIGR02281 family clan AA aspartic protease n=2 Tax=Kineobactrum sediminis TaxID=1905677 RepID=A0A2N5Y6L7_9GAMM|nr:TIGR02281 family clan AA aspartic protease [Kineobactrum sediminis]
MTDPLKQQRRMGLGMQVITWVLILGMLSWYFTGLIDRQHNPNQQVTTMLVEDGVREVVLTRNRQGHYVTSGAINGHPVVFLLDTGATGVAIPMHVAEQLALPRGRAFVTRTANGDSTSYASRLDSVSVGDIKLHDVEAGVATGLRTREVLLGMSFLRHIEFTQRGDTLTLRQYPPG